MYGEALELHDAIGRICQRDRAGILRQLVRRLLRSERRSSDQYREQQHGGAARKQVRTSRIWHINQSNGPSGTVKEIWPGLAEAAFTWMEAEWLRLAQS